MEHVTKGSYSVAVSKLPEDFYIKSANLGRADALKARVPISDDGRDSIEVILSSATGRIRGTVRGDRLEEGEIASQSFAWWNSSKRKRDRCHFKLAQTLEWYDTH